MVQPFLSGLIIGMLLIFLPVGVLLLSGVVWAPWLIGKGIKAGLGKTAIAGAVILALLGVAVAKPKRWEMQPVGQFSTKSVTLLQLAEAGVILKVPGLEKQTIILPNANPTKKEVISAITNQTRLDAQIRFCGYGASVWSGSFDGPIKVREQR